ncbi:MAG: diguanylate cyclase [Rhodanobacteraceae bacterium]|nr:MAG: diguanylate cyclase [Rhodanobacteraceae bacterium]
MTVAAWRWSMLLLCWPVVAGAGDVALRVTALPAAPRIVAGAAAAPVQASRTLTADRTWLRAPHDRVAWYELRLASDWRGSSPPLLSIRGATRARVVAYLPPDYRPRNRTVFDATLDPTLSHHAVVYRLPAALAAAQPLYLALGSPGQTQPIRVAVTDAASYRAGDLWHVRVSTFLVSVQLSMLLVILCFWGVLRDRMFLFFVAYVGAQLVYAMTVSGELFAFPGAGLLTAAGYHTGQAMATLAAAFSIWFILDFADLRRWTPRLATGLGLWCWPFMLLSACIWLPFLKPDVWLPNTVNVLLVISTVLALAATWLAWRGGNRQAGFFLLSWVPLLALTLARVVQLIAGFPLPLWLEYGFPGSMAWSAVIITVGLADSTLQARRERDDVTRMAQFDPLTGVFNRGAIMQRLQRAWQLTAEPLAVLFLDIDHFKQVNDTRGHAAGDACLRAVADAIRLELAAGDRVGRYGGEEFLIMLRGDSARAARQVAERIVARAAGLQVPIGEFVITLTVSIGVALRDASVVDPEALVEYADAAQYRAKAEGRNRVVVQQREAASMLAGMR